jgi:hypothetical protein
MLAKFKALVSEAAKIMIQDGCIGISLIGDVVLARR